jgi:uncharacterized NAD(P)/FAD-binding protein YdhS
MKTIAIIGFGFCGKTLFINLIKNYQPKTKILIFSKSHYSLSSAAFSELSPSYILNVPAKKMSAFLDRENDFCDFLEKYHSTLWTEIGENGFAPRYIYGQYIDYILEAALVEAKEKAVDFEFINQEVVRVFEEGELALELENGDCYEVDDIVLATSFKQAQMPFEFNSKNFVKDLWSETSINFHQNPPLNKTIGLIGSGLSAVDVILSFKKNKFIGNIIAISRHGNLPKKSFLSAKVDLIKVADAKNGVLFLCLKIRKFLRENPQFDLRQVIGSIRNITQELWHNFDEKNKQLFLRRLISYWNIFRHCAPIDSVEMVENMIIDGQLVVKKGSIENIENVGEKISITTKNEEILVDQLVNCLGFEFRADKYRLLSQMMSEQLLKKDCIMAKSNHPKIHLLGGLNIGRDFECTAVPELRLSVSDVVGKLL